jgi:hypothetical protein
VDQYQVWVVLLKILEGNMAKKISFFLAAVLAVLILGIACENDGGGASSYTVTFLKNNDDIDSDVEKVTVKVPAGERLGDKLPNSQFPVVKEGWDAGYMVIGWNTSPGGGGKRLTSTTPINEDWTVYAQWGYKESQYLEDDSLTVIAPAITEGGNMHGTYNGESNSNGSITWNSGGIRWAYPEASADYDYVEIEYIGKGATDTAANIPSNIFKQYNTTVDYTPETGNQYPTFSLPTGKMKFKVKNGEGGIAIQINTSNSAPSYERTMKFTKAVFTRSTRYKITFDPDYSGAGPIEDMYVPANFEIGTLPYLERQNDQDFTGWVLASDGVTNVTETYVVRNNLALKAKWETFTPGTTFTVDFLADGNAGLTPKGSGTTAVPLSGGENGYRFTYGSGNYSSSWAVFKITLDANVRLSAYKELTIQYRSVSGDTAYKPFALLAAAPALPASLPSDPHNGSYKINSPDSQASTNPEWTDLTFTINKAKASRLTNAIELCIYDHSAATLNDEKTVWEIKDVTFVQD